MDEERGRVQRTSRSKNDKNPHGIPSFSPALRRPEADTSLAVERSIKGWGETPSSPDQIQTRQTVAALQMHGDAE